tara:strand:+ start:1396 stop:1653 length:258 start_codon:yes stop_codon:yes gene_type:complete
MNTEGQYLELANDAQERFNAMSLRIKHKDEELMQIKKELISAYGYIRILDHVYQNQEEQEPTITIMLEVLREFLSQFTEDNILNN